MQKIAQTLCLTLAILSLPVLAQERVLLDPLSKTEEAVARAMNDYFIRKYTFSAKRYRLVRVDFALLDSQEPITIPLFNGEKIVVDFDRLDIDHVSGGYIWRGQMVQDKVTPESIRDYVANEEVVRMIFESMTGVAILVDLLERDKESGANLNRVYSFAEAMMPTDEKPDRYGQRYSSPENVLGAAATLQTIGNPNTEYRLRMLGMGGPYHILWEVDPLKVVIPTSSEEVAVGNERGIGEEEQKRREKLIREHNEFFETLGTNPHDALYLKKMKQKGIVR